MESINQQNPFQVSEVQLSYKTTVKPSQRPSITSSKDAYDILRSHWDEGKLDLLEQFKVILTNRANKVLGIFEVSSGGISGVVVDPKLVFIAALKAGATGILLSHNHPSGNLIPSQPDLDLTRKIKEGCKILELTLLDHIIMTSETYYSFADEGLL
ncbi:MAG TPA: JAB domain-containing protein [Ohtaekwangia sp.]|uniref:JAB domain-containing protein n=1 Tax=Ohtaekwangia sp. TaxID=2066019 RepID=UPI002F952095